jgi:hypothetical protein
MIEGDGEMSEKEEQKRQRIINSVIWIIIIAMCMSATVLFMTSYDRERFIGLPLYLLEDNYFYTVKNLFEMENCQIALFLKEEKLEKGKKKANKIFFISRTRLRGQDNKILTLKEIPKKFIVKSMVIFPPEQPGERDGMGVFILIPISSS